MQPHWLPAQANQDSRSKSLPLSSADFVGFGVADLEQRMQTPEMELNVLSHAIECIGRDASGLLVFHNIAKSLPLLFEIDTRKASKAGALKRKR